MQFDEAGTIIRNVTWYFACDEAPVFQGSHYYASDNWNWQQQPELGIGERWDSLRPWTDGARPFAVNPKGQPCGPIDWWRNGVPSDAPDLVLDDRGIPACCTGGCQPWFYGSVGHRKLTTEPNQHLTVVNVDAPGILELLNPGGFIIADCLAGDFTGLPCGVSDNGTSVSIVNVNDGWGGLMELCSYDPTTYTGEYVPIPGDPAWANSPLKRAFFRNPPP